MTFNIMGSEEWDINPRPSAAELLGYIDNGLFASPGNLSDRVRGDDVWPLYPLGPRFNTTADMGDIPTLMLNGDLDAQTPLSGAQAQRAHLRGSNIRLKVLPGVVHMTTYFSPTKAPRSLPCGLQILLSFLGNPAGPINDSCIADLLPVDFHVSAETARSQLGVDDAFDGVPATPTPPPPSPSSTGGVSIGLFLGVVLPLALVTVWLLLWTAMGGRKKARVTLGVPALEPLVGAKP